ncbi:phosphonate metabolism protein PhnM [Heliorestis acidaminivorans]|uniref:Phosphonate metabolism protein PhnM n=1 Tax=Heliorestis acidaminivorans TaxID=553427 RepID=A0A6I0F0U6_9FIRM|nr:phosphonate metabolism protein PhnM [Heliorestis acidaminivorans]KAB2953456.1 phosphonate metabolism protein PhnM [Heliorestis acidaminivorans]
MYLLTNGKIILEDKVLDNQELLIESDRIARIEETGKIAREGLEIIDVKGGYIAPGFIDIHSDYIEHMASPRPSSVLDFRMAIREVEKQLVNQGITTMYHSLSLYKESIFSPKAIRSSENVKKLIDLIEKTEDSNRLIRHRFHARYELDNVDDVNYLLEYIRKRKIHLLSFMDHTPGQGQYRDLELYRETVRGYKNYSDEEIEQHILDLQRAQKLDLETMMYIAQTAIEHQVALASHDDDSLEKLDLVQKMGTSISEFPITLEVAKKAKEKKMHTVAGAPNVLLKGSHSGNLSAIEAIEEGCIDILCSDYYPASLLHALFLLHHKYNKDLPSMLRLVTINPAKALGIDHETGSLAEGKKADIIVIGKVESDYPTINYVFVDGNFVSQLNYLQKKIAM